MIALLLAAFAQVFLPTAMAGSTQGGAYGLCAASGGPPSAEALAAAAAFWDAVGDEGEDGAEHCPACVTADGAVLPDDLGSTSSVSPRSIWTGAGADACSPSPPRGPPLGPRAPPLFV